MNDKQLDVEWLQWDPQRTIFTIPGIDRPVTWYGLLFALGFLLGVWVVRSLAKRHFLLSHQGMTMEQAKQRSAMFTDSLLWFVVLGTVIGGRLGHVLFYGWPFFREHPLEILKVWEGGLSSHGGAIGVLFSLMLYFLLMHKRLPEISFLLLLDFLTVPTALVGCFIRLGNFVNQEILGKVSFVSWAVIFKHPFGGAPALPRHPVQLYEAAFYLLTFVFLFFLWRKKEKVLKEGIISGLFFCLVFAFRFFIEFYKLPQSMFISHHSPGLLMGQYLSVPFIIIGILLLLWSREKNFASCE